MIDIWAGKAVEVGKLISDRRTMFKRSSVINKKLLKELEEIDRHGTLTIYAQTKASRVFKVCEERAKQLLEFDSYTHYNSVRSGGMIFKDCFGGEWKIQSNYYQLIQQLLNFDFLLGSDDKTMVYFVKDNKIIGILMCFH